MAKKSRTPKTRKARASKKSRRARRGAYRGSLKKAWKAAVPPPDNPLLRHRETTADIRIVTGAPVPAAQPAALAHGVRRGKTRRRPLPAPPLTTDRKLVAGRRLTAMAQFRRESRTIVAGPLPARAVRGMAPGGTPPPVAPTPNSSNWIQMGPTAIPNGQTYGGPRVLVTGRVTAIAVDPTNALVIYVGTAQGGIWKTVDGGTEWQPCSDNEASLAIGALTLDPSNSQIVYAGTGEGNFSGDSYYGAGVLRSTNGGGSWTLLGANMFTGARFGRIAVTPGTPARVFAATSSGIYRSLNSGTTWTQLSGGLPTQYATDVVIDPTTPTTVYAAFWGNGIYKCTNAGAGTPTWTKLAGGLPAANAAPPGGFNRVVLGLSPSSPQTLFALFSNNMTNAPNPSNNYVIDKLYVSTDGGSSWTPIPLPGGSIGAQGFYNINVAVDPTTPDIVYLSGISLWKATRSTTTGTWTIVEIGGAIHPDNHALAFDPANHLVIYAGNDGGIYKSTDGGTTWFDGINEGLCITQFEFIAQHPTSDAVVFGGTQDNGTEQFRNSPVFSHADDGDGGFCLVDQTQPRNVISTYYGPSPKRSTVGGAFGSWAQVWNGISGSSQQFYPPLVADDTNSNNIAVGTDRVNLDGSQGTTNWPTKVTLPGASPQNPVTAMHYVNANLIYAGTTLGSVYRLTKSGTTWSANAIHGAPLPTGAMVTDLSAVPGSPDTVIVVLSGFGPAGNPLAHVWRGVVPATGQTTWTNVSGTGAGALPDIPVNALVIEPGAPATMYIASDIAVWITTSGGASWAPFSDGLPNVAVFDLALHTPSRLLRAATHGRGLWERKLDAAVLPNADIYLRDHLMSTSRILPTPEGVPAAFVDPLQYVGLGDPLYHWMCCDIKVDALEGSPPAYQAPVSGVDYVTFEASLQHRNAQRGNVNRVYVQVHNRGFAAAANVTVKLLYAPAAAGLPALPPDFWTAFPNDAAAASLWQPVGTAKTIASLSPTAPAILEWDWTTPVSAPQHSCLLAIIDGASDPIPAGSKVFDVDVLVANEKRAGLKNLHVVDAPTGTMPWRALDFYGGTAAAMKSIRVISSQRASNAAILLPKSVRPRLTGLVEKSPTQAQLRALKETLDSRLVAALDTTRLYTLADGESGRLDAVPFTPKGFTAAVLLPAAARGAVRALTIVQEDEAGAVGGGSTFVVRGLP
ncbi:MAG TPA: hypothetical protein VH679_12035 [Vicinamibacterales bacterium]